MKTQIIVLELVKSAIECPYYYYSIFGFQMKYVALGRCETDIEFIKSDRTSEAFPLRASAIGSFVG